MSILTAPSSAFSTSLIYITVGTLIDIWTIVSLLYYPPSTDWGHFLVIGFLVTGIALLVIGLLLGPIGRAARHAELPPTEVTAALTNAEQIAAANPPPVLPVNTMPSTGAVVEPQVPSPPPVTPISVAGQNIRR